MKSKNQLFLKALLLLQTIALSVYTFFTFQADGINFISKAVEYVSSSQWAGQFVLDFACYLLLSGIWIMWRAKFSGKAIFTAIVAMIFGIVFFAPYLLFLVAKHKGNVKIVLLGEN